MTRFFALGVAAFFAVLMTTDTADARHGRRACRTNACAPVTCCEPVSHCEPDPCEPVCEPDPCRRRHFRGLFSRLRARKCCPPPACHAEPTCCGGETIETIETIDTTEEPAPAPAPEAST